MKQKFLNLKSWLLMMCLLVGVGNAWAEDDVIYSTGFESDFTTSTTYTGTVTSGPKGKQWKVTSGTFSTNSAINGSNSAQTRLYSTTVKTPVVETCFTLENVTKVTFYGAFTHTGNILVQYSTDGENWTGDQTFTSSSTTALKTYNMPQSYDGSAVYFRFVQNYTAKPSSGNKPMRIDDVTVYGKATSGGTDSQPTALSVPSNLSASSITTTGATLSWDAVTNASSYTVKIGEVEYADVKTNSYSATGLTAGTQYTWTVKAVGDGTNYSTGDYASNATFTTDELTPAQKFNVTILGNILNGEVSANPTQATVGTEVTLTATPASGYKFSAWDVKDANDNAITVTNNKFTMPEADVNVSATFVEKPEPAGQTVAFVLEYGGKMLAAGVNIASSKAPAVEVTVKDGKVYVSEENAEKISWLLTESETEGKYTIQPKNDTEHFLSAAPGSANLSLAKNECLWTDKGDGTYWIPKADGTQNYYRTITYQAGSTTAFKAYTASNIGSSGYASTAAFAMPIVVVPTFASLDALIAADYTEPTVVNVTINSVVSNGLYLEGAQSYLATLSNVSIYAPSSSDLNWMPNGTVTGTLTNVEWVPTTKQINGDANIWSSLEYTAPDPTYTEKSLTLVAQGEMPTAGTDMGGGAYPGFFATFSSNKDVFIPVWDDSYEFMTSVYTVFTDGEDVLLEPAESVYVDEDKETGLPGYYVPKFHGVLLFVTPEEDVNDITISYYEIENVKVPSLSSDNMLRAATTTKETDDSYKFYMLAYSDSDMRPESLGFYYGAEDGAAFTSREGTAYLAVPADQANAKGFRFVADDATAIKNVDSKVKTNAVYNLAGQRVSTKGFKGVVIKNGKKMLNK